MDLLAIAFLTLFLISLVMGKLLNKSYDNALVPIVIILIITISSWASSSISSSFEVLKLISLSIAYALITILITFTIGLLLDRRMAELKVSKSETKISFIFAIIAGWILGQFLPKEIPYRTLISYELLILAVAAGISVGKLFSIELLKKSAKVTFLTCIAAIIGAICAGTLNSFLFGIDIKASLSICLGMGWYTYIGPLLASYEGSFIGNLAFLSNFLREQFTFIIVPFIKGNPSSLISIGGATSMDDTLPVFISRLGKEYSIPSIASGFILTLLIPIIIPIIFAF
ncbi:MAG: lysine exporter LysO family protein [Thermoproteota archaeon]|nr:lysine exporter LysO family protein [Thermoproteota archaeon]